MGAPHTTPGPWMISAGPSSVVGWPIVSCGSEHAGRSISNLSWMPGLPEDVERTIRANGLQMAASPKLYDALEAMLAASQPPSSLGPRVTMGEAQAMATAALAEARGEPLEQDR